MEEAILGYMSLNAILVGRCARWNLQSSLYLLLGCSVVPATAFAGDVPESAISGWNVLRSAVDTPLRGTIRTRRVVRTENAEGRTEDSAFEFAASGSEMVVRRLLKDGVEVTASNASYIFDAKSKSDDGPFELGDIRRGVNFQSLDQHVRDSWEPFLFSGFEIFAKTMPELVSSDGFALQALDIDETEKSAKMTFQYTSSNRPPDTAITGGAITFDTSRFWAIRNYECTTIWGRVEGTIEYQPFGECVIPKSTEQIMRGDVNRSETVETFVLENIEQLPHDVKLPVHLEDYGLREPATSLQTARSGRWPIFWLNAVLVSIVAVLFWYFRRRQRVG